METENSEMKRMSLIELRANMVLAQDILNGYGAILLPRNTILSDGNFDRLSSNGIDHVFIKKKSINLKNPVLMKRQENLAPEPQPSSVVEQKTFIDFEAEHEKKTKELTKSLLSISDGGLVKMDELYSLTDGVMSKLTCKSDVLSYLNFLKDSDDYTFGHSNNVALLANLFGIWLGMGDEELMYLTTAGILHDIGKTQLNQAILSKPGKLTPDEFEHIKSHASRGFQILESQNIPRDVKLAALMHHEKMDGSGYPMGITGDKIGKFAKIIAICDIYDAMTANRVYRDKLTPFDVIKLFEQRSFGVLDTEYLLIFLANIAYTYVGSWVELTNGIIGQIIFVQRNNLSCPLIKAGREMIDLSSHENKNIHIKKVV